MSNYQTAVQAALHGPEVKEFDVAGGHKFNIKPLGDSVLYGDRIVVTGQISHCLHLQPADQCYYRIEVTKGSVLSISRSYNEPNAVKKIFEVAHAGGSIVISIFNPAVGAVLLASTDKLGDAIDKVNDLAVGDYKGVCDNLIGLIAIGLADQFGRANEWISIRTPPDSAIVGGHISDSPKPVYIGRANHNGNVHPGKVAYYDGGWHCYIGNGGKEQVYDTFEVLLRT